MIVGIADGVMVPGLLRIDGHAADRVLHRHIGVGDCAGMVRRTAVLMVLVIHDGLLALIRL